MKSKRDCLIEQEVKQRFAQRYGEIAIPNTDSSDFLSAAVSRSGTQAETLAMRQPSDESPVTMVVADDHPVILEGLIKILNSQKDIRVVASAADGQDVSKLYYQFLPDVLILDLRLPKKDGLQVLNELMARANPKPRVVIITTFDCEQAIFQAVRAGSQSFSSQSCRSSRNPGSSALGRQRGNLFSVGNWFKTS
jgi:CheY-like chemotaxis protein